MDPAPPAAWVLSAQLRGSRRGGKTTSRSRRTVRGHPAEGPSGDSLWVAKTRGPEDALGSVLRRRLAVDRPRPGRRGRTSASHVYWRHGGAFGDPGNCVARRRWLKRGSLQQPPETPGMRLPPGFQAPLAIASFTGRAAARRGGAEARRGLGAASRARVSQHRDRRGAQRAVHERARVVRSWRSGRHQTTLSAPLPCARSRIDS